MSTNERSFDHQLARIAAGGYDDAQAVRKAMMNRVRDVVRRKDQGIPFDQTESEKEDPDYSSEYDDENLPEVTERMLEDDTLNHYEYEYLMDMLDAARAASEVEAKFESVMGIVAREPIYSDYLDHVYGISTTLTAKLIHTYGYCEDFPHPAKIWAYTGYAPGQERKRGEQLNFDPEAKTLLWNVADCMIKQGSRSLYRTNFYEPYKETQLERLERANSDECIKCGSRPPTGNAAISSRLPGSTGRVTVEAYGDEDGDPIVTTDDGKVVILPDADAQIGDQLNVKITSDLEGYALGTVNPSEDYSEGLNPSKSVPDGSENLCTPCNTTLLNRGEHPPTPPESLGHADARARRYLAKKFLKHYWAIARDLKDLPTPSEYIVSYGGHEEKTDTFENPFYAKRQLTEP